MLKIDAFDNLILSHISIFNIKPAVAGSWFSGYLMPCLLPAGKCWLRLGSNPDVHICDDLLGTVARTYGRRGRGSLPSSCHTPSYYSLIHLAVLLWQ